LPGLLTCGNVHNRWSELDHRRRGLTWKYASFRRSGGPGLDLKSSLST
jgi:hypothetical protein